MFFRCLGNSICELPCHWFTFFSYDCIILKDEEERSLMSFIVGEGSVNNMGLDWVKLWIVVLEEGLTTDSSDVTRYLNTSSMSMWGFIVKCRAPIMIGFGSLIILWELVAGSSHFGLGLVLTLFSQRLVLENSDLSWDSMWNISNRKQ